MTAAQRRWRIRRDILEGMAGRYWWEVDAPGCDPEGSHPRPCWEFDTWPEALAYVNDQIRADSLRAIQNQEAS